VQKIFPMLLKYVRLKGNLKYEPKESCDNFSLPGLENPTQIPASIAGKLQQELLLVAAVSDMPNTTSGKMTVSFSASLSIEAAFRSAHKLALLSA